MSSQRLSLVACFLLLSALLADTAIAVAPDRATRYDGASYYTYGDHPAFREPESITIEAWVLREDSGRCETIISKGFQSSWWLGFCNNRLRFYTSGGFSLDANRGVIANQWCHVAATLTSTGEVAFYIDQQPAGGGELPALVDHAGPLTVGANIDGNFAFLGSLDEIRIWSVARDAADIGRGLFTELLGDPNQLAGFPEGGPREAIHALAGTPTGSPMLVRSGVLPSYLCAPWISGGSSGAAGDVYSDPGADERPFRYRCAQEVSGDATIQVVQTPEVISIGVSNLAAARSKEGNPVLAFLIDPVIDGNGTPTAGEYAVFHYLNGGIQPCFFQGDGQQGWVDCAQTDGCPDEGLLELVVIADCASEELAPCVELRISKSLLPAGATQFALGLWHFGVEAPDSEPIFALLPDEASVTDPSTWMRVDLPPPPAVGSGTCGDPFVMPPTLPSIRVESLDGSAPEVDRAPCLPLPTLGPDASYVFTAPEAGIYRAVVRSVSDGAPNLALAISDCPATESGCILGADSNGGGAPEIVETQLAAGETVLFLVDSHLEFDGSEPDLGEIELRIDRVLDPRLLLADVAVATPKEFEEAVVLYNDVWSADATNLRVLGAASPETVADFESRDFGVSVYVPSPGPGDDAPPSELRFSQARYDVPATITIHLTDPGDEAVGTRAAWILTESSGDVEEITIHGNGAAWIGSIELEPGAAGDPHDGTLHAGPGELLTALAQVGAGDGDVVQAFALVKPDQPSASIEVVVDPTLSPPVTQISGRSADEPPRPLGVVAVDGARVTLGSDQLIYSLRGVSPEQRQAFQADVLADLGDYAPAVFQNSPLSGDTPSYLLVRLQPESVDPGGVAHLFELLGAPAGTIRVSDERTLGVLAAWLDETLRGRPVQLNLVGELHGWPTTDLDGEDAFQQPHVADCLQGTHKAWTFAALSDADIRSVRVAVIDRNFCPAFPDELTIAGYWNVAFGGGPPPGIVSSPGDGFNHHGTKMASVLGSHVDSGLDTAGSGGQVAELLLYDTGPLLFMADVTDAIRHAVIAGAEVINMSLGFRCDPPLFVCPGNPDCSLLLNRMEGANWQSARPSFESFRRQFAYRDCIQRVQEATDAFRAAVQAAVDNGVVVVASAGNEQTSAFVEGIFGGRIISTRMLPANYPEVISVGVTDFAYQNTRNHGSTVDVWVLETTRAYANPDDTSTSCEPRDLIDVNGSSSGAAYVSGIVALIRAVNPSLDPGAIQSLLRGTSDFAPGGDRRVARFLRSGDAVVRAGTFPVGNVPRLGSFAPSLGLDEDDASAAAVCGGGFHLLGDSPESPIFIAFADAASPTGWLRTDASIHPFGDGPGYEEDHYRIGSAPAGNQCTTYRVIVDVVQPRLYGGGLQMIAPFRADDFGGASLPDFLRDTRTFENVILGADRPFQFEVGGDDGVYQLRVTVEPSGGPTVADDRFESNDTSAQASIHGADEFRRVYSPHFVEHHLRIPELSFACSGDVDVFRLQLPEEEESCDFEIPDYCGDGVDAALRDLTPRVVLRAYANIRVLTPAGVELARGDGGVRVDCPRTNGHDELVVELRRFTRDVRAYEYELDVSYRLPRTEEILQELSQRAAQVICCDGQPEGCLVPLAESRYPPGAVKLDAFSPQDLEPRTFAFQAECEDEDCEVQPTMYIAYEWPETSVPLALEFEYLSPGLPPDTLEIDLISSELGVVASADPVNEDEPGLRRLGGGGFPVDSYFVRVRGLDPNDVFTIGNIEPLADPEAPRLRPVLLGDDCPPVTIGIEVRAPEPVSGLQFELGWDPDVVSILDMRPAPAFEGFTVLQTPLEPGRMGIGLADVQGGRQVDATTPTIAVEVDLQVSGVTTSTPVCVRDVVGSAPEVFEPTVTVGLGGDAVSLRAGTGCVEVTEGIDTEPPTIVCPTEVLQQPTVGGAIVTWTVQAIDDCGDVDVVCTPPSGSELPHGTSVVICEATDASGNVAECEFEVTVEATPFRRGDANDDRLVDISDAIVLLEHLFLGEVAPTCHAAGDTNDDQKLDITDPIVILQFLFLGETPPPAPGPTDCGPDPTPDGRDCVYTSCG